MLPQICSHIEYLENFDELGDSFIEASSFLLVLYLKFYLYRDEFFDKQLQDLTKPEIKFVV